MGISNIGWFVFGIVAILVLFKIYVRQICPKCKWPCLITVEEKEIFRKANNFKVMARKKCKKCGYEFDRIEEMNDGDAS